jgi:hypothetical protein
VVFRPVENADQQAIIARLTAHRCSLDLQLTAAINGYGVKPDIAPGMAPASIGSGVPQFFRRPDEPKDKVPDRYRNWMTDEQWQQGCEAEERERAAGRSKLVSVTGPTAEDMAAAGKYVMDAQFAE